MLVAGPPGYGKTTLAHVVGHQLGYNVMEVNARYGLFAFNGKTPIEALIA